MNGKTKVLTDHGWMTIESMEGRKINIWNGKQWSTVVAKKTGEKEYLQCITIDSGASVCCSFFTKFYIEETIQDRGKDNTTINEIFGTDLKVGDRLLSYNLPIVRDVNADYEKSDQYYKMLDPYTEGQSNGDIMIGYNNYKRPYIPFAYDIKTKLKWLAGFLDKFAIVEETQIKISNKHHRFGKIKLYELQLLLQSLGIYSCVNSDGNSRFTGPTFKLTFTIGEMNKLLELGIKFKKIQKSNIKFVEKPETIFSNKILKIEGYPGMHETYIFKEHLENMAIFDGVLCSTSLNE